MDLRTHYPFSLLKYGLINSYPSLDKNLKTDVAIIGAGISGALMAWELQQKGIDCALFDKRHVAMGSTAASTSLIQYEIDTPLHKLTSLVGYDQAVRSYLLCKKAITDLEEICHVVDEKENFKKKCSLQFATFGKHVEGLKKEFDIRKQHGFKVEFLDRTEIRKQFHFNAPAAIYSHEAAQVDAYLLTHKILKWVSSRNVGVYDHTSVESIEHQKNRVVLKTAEGWKVQAKYLVIACGYESGRYIKKKIEELRCTFAIVSEPVKSRKLWRDNSLIWETKDPYLYLRTTDDNRILIGGKDEPYFNLDTNAALVESKAKSLQRSFQKMFPHIRFKIDFKWGGAFGKTRDGLPYIGSIPEHPRTYFALGYGGNGISFSVIAARLISEVINGKKPDDMELFSFNR
jgi:glycine/D-amino acid oxidase-like deaminating enzyme